VVSITVNLSNFSPDEATLVGAPTETSGLDNTLFNLSILEGRDFKVPLRGTFDWG